MKGFKTPSSRVARPHYEAKTSFGDYSGRQSPDRPSVASKAAKVEREKNELIRSGIKWK